MSERILSISTGSSNERLSLFPMEYGYRSLCSKTDKRIFAVKHGALLLQ